ncbi:MAG: hypothetical protein E6772_11350 [Dysgonomonas sp.]|nr:hypothetical protein [Dysgonomonas sp.]
MKRTYIYIIATLWGLATFPLIQAQVTIGADKKPNPGAFLEFVENLADSTSNRGLLLPRVRLNAIADATPLTNKVEGMLVYNKTQNASVNSDVYINDGTNWNSLLLPTPSAAGQYLVLNSSLEPEWRTINLPQPVPGVYSLMNSDSRNLYSMLTINSDNSPWLKYGDTITVKPRHATNRMVITVQVLFNKEYDPANPTGWVNYDAGLFINDFTTPVDVRNQTLTYQSFNNSRVYSPVTLHFVVTNLTAGEQKVLIKFKQLNSENFDGILFVGYDSTTPPGVPGDINLFNTSASISSQYFEDKSSPII